MRKGVIVRPRPGHTAGQNGGPVLTGGQRFRGGRLERARITEWSGPRSDAPMR